MFKMAQFMVPQPVDKMVFCIDVANMTMAEFSITFTESESQIIFEVREDGLTADGIFVRQEETKTRKPGEDCGTRFVFEGTDAAVQVEPIVLANGGRLAIVCWAPTTAELP